MEHHKTLLLVIWTLTLPCAYLGIYFFGFHLPPLNNWLSYLTFLLVSPLLEEYIFRAGLQHAVWRQAQRWLVSQNKDRHSALIAIFISALGFAAAHSVRLDGLMGGRWLIWSIPGFALALIWQFSNSLKLCVLTHAWFNLAFLISAQRQL